MIRGNQQGLPQPAPTHKSRFGPPCQPGTMQPYCLFCHPFQGSGGATSPAAVFGSVRKDFFKAFPGGNPSREENGAGGSTRTEISRAKRDPAKPVPYVKWSERLGDGNKRSNPAIREYPRPKGGGRIDDCGARFAGGNNKIRHEKLARSAAHDAALLAARPCRRDSQ